MTHDALELFIHRTQAAWGPLTSELAAGARDRLEELARSDASQRWIAALHDEAPEKRELARDEQRGFVLLAHTEPAGLYRPPHDHGRGWVVYALQRGEIAMSTYAKIESDAGIELVKRDERVLRAGEAQLFLPGDIHDTRCLAGPALLFRFSSVDLGREKVTRFVDRNGRWTVPA